MDEESIIEILWNNLGGKKKGDPFNDDAAWMHNFSKNRLVVTKADMLVATTDAPPQMSPSQMARKAVVSCASDFSAKGIRPRYCTVSLGLPKELVTREYISAVAEGFSAAEAEYGITIVGGDTNVTRSDPVIDCSIIGFGDKVVPRRGAKPGQLIGVSGKFGLPPAGLLLLSGKAKTDDKIFEGHAIDSVLHPRARLKLGLKAARYFSSCIDSSDGLAISLYHLAESSRVNFELYDLPIHEGIPEFSRENGQSAEDLVLFGGEEYELVSTFDRKHEKTLSKLGIITIGKVKTQNSQGPAVMLNSKTVPRRGWIHFRSEA